ncbi:winged helix DNA-binding domain-containing protein [Cellulomonas soli]|uniref:winged helix DNA-binding domain-containing protein n=1 Tax=Cellulomonas soli TaxID=931535 RepID=UPI003F85677E
MDEVPALDRRALNRALLARQGLLVRGAGTVLGAVEHLVGLQAQNMGSPYVALWSRLAAFTPAQLGDALVDRTAARIAVMRGTIHLVTAQDALLLPRLMAPLFARDLERNASHRDALAAVDLGELAALARALVEERPRVTTELGALLTGRWPRVPSTTLAYAARGTLPLVQVPPRGVWGRSGPTTWTTADSWLGASATDAPDLDDPDVRAEQVERMVLRYLAAFGPASVADVQTWSGLTGLRAVVERLRPRLRVFRTAAGEGPARGRELVDLPDAPRPPSDVTAPVRFLPDLDNVLLSHADRSRIVPDEVRVHLRSPNGVLPGTVLVDGTVGATWAVTRTRLRPGGSGELARLTLTPLRPWPAAARREALAEGERFVRFLADDATEHAVAVAEA